MSNDIINKDSLVGKTKEEALKILKENNSSYRIMEEDGQSYAGTCDFKRFRINLTITNGIVEKIRNG